MQLRSAIVTGLCLAALAACGRETAPAEGEEAHAVQEPVDNAVILDAVLAGDHRTDEERARDAFRHPKETLLFFGIEPDMTVVEAWPGGGWYTQIIAPYLNAGGGKLYAAGFPFEGASERVTDSLNAYRSTYVDHPDIYGDVEMTALDEGRDAAPEGTADAVVSFRNVHNWLARGSAEEFFAEFYRALKPGGVLGIVEHRADDADLPRDGSSGYVYEQTVIDLATDAGFEFDGRSDINANPLDTKDHPFGVWTLPPVRRSSEMRGMEDPNFNRAPYDAIGESDRMTLKFRKPAMADGEHDQ